MALYRDIVNNNATCALGIQTQCNVISGLRVFVATVSLLGCIFMLSLIWLFSKYHTLSQRLILYLTVAAALNSISFIVNKSNVASTIACNFNAWFNTFANWSILLWVCCITFNLYNCAVRMVQPSGRFEWAYHLIAWVVPVILAFIPLFGHHYGPSEFWCWIQRQYPGWRFGLWYIPLFVIILLLFVAYFYIFWKVRMKNKDWQGPYNQERERDMRLLREDVKPVIWYPFIFLACSMFPLINRIQNAVSSDLKFGLVVMHTISSPLAGALNAIVFGMDKEITSRLTQTQMKQAFVKHFQRSTNIGAYGIRQEFDTNASYSSNVSGTGPGLPSPNESGGDQLGNVDQGAL